MKKMFSFHARKAGNAIASFALLAGFAAFVVLVASPTVPGDTLGAQAGGGRPGAAPSEPKVPDAPTLNSATAEDGQVVLQWSIPRSDGGSPITTYNVRYTDESGRSSTVNAKSTGTLYTVTGLTNDSVYTFEVAAVNSIGQSVFSNGIQATPTAPKTTAPGSPTKVSARSGDGQIELAWFVPENDGRDTITNYVISYIPGKGTEVVVDAGNVTAYTLTGLTNGVEYTIKIAAENSVGVGAYSTEVVTIPETSASVPGVPTNVSVRASSASIDVSWLAPRDTGGSDITNYVVSYTPQGGSETLVNVGTDTTYSITRLVNGTEYTIKILAQNENGDSQYTDEVAATPSTIPDAPQNVVLTPGDGTLAVSWEAPRSNGGSVITEYTISYAGDQGEQTVSVQGATSYTLERLVNGSSYKVRVLATNSNGDSAYTSPVTGSPRADVAPAIVGLPSVVPSERSAVIAWATNINTSTKVDFGLLNITTATREFNRDTRVVNHSVTVDNLLPCTTYSYRVKSYDALSREATSSEQVFTTTGCVAEVEEVKRELVDTTVGATLDFARASEEVRARLVVPANLKVGATDVVFQVKKLEKQETKEEIGKPDNRLEWLGEHVYNLTAYGSESEEVNNFDNPITVTIQYNREDVQGFDLNTLKIHHFEDGIGWRSLENCENSYNPNTGTGEISCQTSSFSIFGLFGENAVGSRSVSSGTYVSTSTNTTKQLSDQNVQISEDSLMDTENLSDNSIDEAKITPSNLNLPQFTQDLRIGLNNSLDVFNLQKFLNAQGFILANEGPGSPGRETSYFGPRTQNALKRFQETYSDAMFEMFGARPQTLGVFGEWTRKFIEMQFRQGVE